MLWWRPWLVVDLFSSIILSIHLIIIFAVSDFLYQSLAWHAGAWIRRHNRTQHSRVQGNTREHNTRNGNWLWCELFLNWMNPLPAMDYVLSFWYLSLGHTQLFLITPYTYPPIKCRLNSSSSKIEIVVLGTREKTLMTLIFEG